LGQEWWLTPIIPVIWRNREEHYGSKPAKEKSEQIHISKNNPSIEVHIYNSSYA
jgi:hypothetical protein